MWIYAISIALAGGVYLAPQPAFANPENSSTSPAVNSESQDMTVVGIALADHIQDREPVGLMNSSVSCERSESSQGTAVPVVDSRNHDRVFFWNTVKSNADTTLRHIWLMKRDQSWKPMAEVDLKIGKSRGYRTWSSKKFDRNSHLGEWKIEVANADHPEEILCESSFRVE